MSCVFCDICSGKIGSSKVYEDELVIAFLDVNPVSEGYTLIVPRKHYENIYDIPETELKRIIVTAKKLSQKYKMEKAIDAVNLMHASGKEAQQSVYHFHIHLIPRRKNDGLNLWIR